MQLEELKSKIESGSLDENLIIFIYSDTDFIFHQYLDAYKRDDGVNVCVVESLYEIPESNIFQDSSNCIWIYDTDTLSGYVPKTPQRVWIKCRKVDKALQKEFGECIVTLPKLEDWQVLDYVKSNITGLEEFKLKLFLDTYKKDLYRIENEVQKITIFPEDMRRDVYYQVEDQLYCDISQFTIFNFVNSIIRRDKRQISQYYLEINNMDVEPYGLLKLLIDNFKRVIDIQLAKTPTPESAHVSDKQFWAIKKYSCNFYTREELIDIYRFLTGIDLKIKTGYLDTKIIVDYITTHILLIGE